MSVLNGGSVSQQFYGLDHFSAVTASGDPELLQDGEELYSNFGDVTLATGEECREQGAGTLYVTTRQIIWLKGNTGGFCAPFDRISMHAVSQAAEPLKAPCIYAQLDGNTADAAAAEDEDDDDIDEAGHSGPNDIRLIPSDEAHEDGDADNEFFYNQEEALAGAGADERARSLQHLESVLQLGDGLDDEDEMADGDLEAHEGDERFEDPDEDPDEDHPQSHQTHRQ